MNGNNVKSGILKTIEMQANLFSLSAMQAMYPDLSLITSAWKCTFFT
jgi:hypothetical protein